MRTLVNLIRRWESRNLNVYRYMCAQVYLVPIPCDSKSVLMIWISVDIWLQCLLHDLCHEHDATLIATVSKTVRSPFRDRAFSVLSRPSRTEPLHPSTFYKKQGVEFARSFSSSCSRSMGRLVDVRTEETPHQSNSGLAYALSRLSFSHLLFCPIYSYTCYCCSCFSRSCCASVFSRRRTKFVVHSTRGRVG